MARVARASLRRNEAKEREEGGRERMARRIESVVSGGREGEGGCGSRGNRETGKNNRRKKCLTSKMTTLTEDEEKKTEKRLDMKKRTRYFKGDDT